MHFTLDPSMRPWDLDQLIAAGKGHPGIFRLGDNAGPRNYKWQVNDAPGAQGAIMIYRGWRPTLDIKGSFYFWASGQVEQFMTEYAPIWDLDLRKFSVKPVEVYHPVLAANDVTKLVTVQGGSLSGNAKIGWTIPFTWHEHRPAKVVGAQTPKGATADLGKPTPESRTEEAIQAEQEKAARPY